MNNSSSLHEIIKIPLLPDSEKERDFIQGKSLLLQTHSVHPEEYAPYPPEDGVSSSLILKKHAKSMGSSVVVASNDIKGFRELYVRNKLVFMGLDLPLCEKILMNMNLDNPLDSVVASVVEQYFLEEAKEFEVANEVTGQTSGIQGLKENNATHGSRFDDEDFFPIGKMMLCEICLDKRPEAEFRVIPGSGHSFCEACIRNYLQTSIHSNGIIAIKCPDDCPYFLQPSDVETLLDSNPELFQKYLKFRRILELSKNPHIRWCVRPGCDNHLLGESGSKMLSCEKCGQNMCYQCKNEWHEGRTCEEAMNQEFKRYVERVVVKECPSCHNGIEKIEGCNHMTCGKCRFQFCWLCGGKYGPNHYWWFNVLGCPGMQYSRFDRKGQCRICFERFGRILLIILLIPIVLALVAIAIPVGLVLLSLFGPFALFCEKCRPSLSCCGVFVTMLMFILSIAISPITCALIIFPGIPIIIYEKCKGRI